MEKIQHKTIRILNFKGPLAEASNLYKELKRYTENCRFVFDQLKKNLSKNFSHYFAVKKISINIIREGKN